METRTVKCPNCGTPLSARLAQDGVLVGLRLAPKPKRVSPPPPVERAVAPVPKAQVIPRPPRTARPSFEEWLLSERNIKIALYSGALLLVLAGIVFVGSRWGEFGGPVKFAVILLVTGLLYLGGHLLYQRPGLRLGSVAVLGVASGFLPLNFAVLQIYVLGPSGFRGDVMWLIASPTCFLLYALTAYWAQASLFTCLSVGALVSALTAGMALLETSVLVYPLVCLLFTLALLYLAWELQKTPLAGFTRTPLLLMTHLALPVLILAALACLMIDFGPGLTLLAIYVGVLCYVATDALFGWWAARWAAAGLFPLAFGLTLMCLDFDDVALGVALKLLALIYLGVGYILERRQGKRKAGWPFYATAFILAYWVTRRAMGDTSVLSLALLGDVVILAVSGAIFEHVVWRYGAAWLFMLPAYLFVSRAIPVMHGRGLWMGVLGLNYLAAGYALSRREVSAGDLPRRGGPFLTAAAFLSVVVVALAWHNALIVTLLLASLAVLYLGVALWLDQTLLLFPVLAAVNLGVYTWQEALLGYDAASWRTISVAYATLTLVLLPMGLWLRRLGYSRWATPLYVVGVCDLLGSYGAALFDPPLAIALSIVYTTLLLMFAWLERGAVKRLGLGNVPVLTGPALAFIVVGHFYALDVVGLLRDWPPFTAGLCGLFVLIAWGLRRGEPAAIYGLPLRWVGLGLTLLPMAGALASIRAPVVVAAFGIAGLTYGADAAVRRLGRQIYLAVAAFMIVYWTLLSYLGATELQAYVVPLGLVLLGMSWGERRYGNRLVCRMLTVLGLDVLLVSSFIQSLFQGDAVYAAWLGIESLAVVGWGVRIRSRSCVSLGTLILLAHTLVQFGPAFFELPRWVQLAVTGGLLLGSGMVFLIKREELLRAHRAFTKEWKGWQP